MLNRKPLRIFNMPVFLWEAEKKRVLESVKWVTCWSSEPKKQQSIHLQQKILFELMIATHALSQYWFGWMRRRRRRLITFTLSIALSLNIKTMHFLLRSWSWTLKLNVDVVLSIIWILFSSAKKKKERNPNPTEKRAIYSIIFEMTPIHDIVVFLE